MTAQNMLVATNLNLSYEGRLILSGASVALQTKRHVALIGPNGAGKTTLLRTIAGEIRPDEGQISRTQGSDLSFVPQVVRISHGQTVADFLASSSPVLTALDRELRTLEREMASATDSHLPVVMAAYDRARTEFEVRDGWSAPDRLHRAQTILAVDHIEIERSLKFVSGGERVRLALAAAYAQNPDFLLLDEPSAHLDAAGKDWLAKWLRETRSGLLFATHDRWLIDAVGAEIAFIDIETQTLGAFGGTYSEYRDFLGTERIRRVSEYQRYEENLNELKRALSSSATVVGHSRAIRDNDKAAYKSRGARVQKAVSHRLRSVQEQIERMIGQPVPQPAAEIKFMPQFDTISAGETPALVVAAHLSVRVSFTKVVDDLSFHVRPGDHICFVGRNGSGKSSLLSLLAEGRNLSDETLMFHPDVRLGYLPQHLDTFSARETIAELLRRRSKNMDIDWEILFTRLVTLGLVERADLSRSVHSMSGGERRQVEIGLLTSTPVDLLILDEPTNFLAFDVLDRMENALTSFSGGIVSASHDRWFLDRLPTEVINLEEFESSIRDEQH
jgi:macrolide transport system ATP-binding/permease protein